MGSTNNEIHNRHNISAWEKNANDFNAVVVLMISVTEESGYLVNAIPSLDKKRVIEFLQTTIEELKLADNGFNPIK